VKAEACRVARLLRCPTCGAWFLYRSDYEYLVSGTEDEQWLERLTGAQGDALFRGLPGQGGG
jgi:hypothetical protein